MRKYSQIQREGNVIDSRWRPNPVFASFFFLKYYIIYNNKYIGLHFYDPDEKKESATCFSRKLIGVKMELIDLHLRLWSLC